MRIRYWSPNVCSSGLPSGSQVRVCMLLANGADPSVVDGEGNTPLHHAARSSDPGVVAALLDAGATLDVLNHEGLSPLAMACAVANWRVARLLLERGATPAPVDGQPALLAADRKSTRLNSSH